ncbi:MAG: hypothetical protein DHS20C18_21140 [Saprospiraceae bacterium]|nr:MAG: hypothetical protein DHS20C18_21140 [Saprospiraceae bacterium]
MVGVKAQGIEFFHGSWEEALAKAKMEEKIIFVDAYASWCGPCKRMAANVFPLPEVGEFFNKNFISLKLDMEKDKEGIKFRQKYPVSAFPTLYFIDYNEEVIQVVRGAQQADALIKLGEGALQKVDRSGEFEEAYEQGDRNPELVYNYVKALNRAGKSSLKIANEYIRDQKDLTTEQNLRFLLEATTEADSRIFTLMIDHRKQLEALIGEEEVETKVLMACQATAQKGIEFENKALIDEAINKMKQHYPQKAENFAIQTRMSFCLACQDAKDYVAACKDYAKKIAKNDPNQLDKIAMTLSKQFGDDTKAMKAAENFAETAAKGSNRYEFYITYADILYKNGKQKDALEAANKSLELAQNQGPNAIRSVEGFIQRIQG